MSERKPTVPLLVRFPQDTYLQLRRLSSRERSMSALVVEAVQEKLAREAEMPRAWYDKGYQAGLANRDGDEQARQFWDAVEKGPGISPEGEGEFWLGYYHGRYERREGHPPSGALGRRQN